MKTAFALSLLMVAMMAAVSVYGWIEIPEGAQIARHWNLAGEPDGFTPRDTFLIGMPLLGLALTLLFLVLPRLDRKNADMVKTLPLFLIGWLAGVGLMFTVHAAIVLAAIREGASPSLPETTLFAAASVLMIIGNFLGKSRPNRLVGVRTPWSLSSKHAWSASNRAAGQMLVLTGLGAAAAGVLADAPAGFMALTAGALASIAISVAISYFAWRNDPER